MKNIIGLRDLRLNMNKYVAEIKAGRSFLVFKQSKPLFRISPIEESDWEEVIDFTKLKKGGIKIDEILSRL